MNEKINNRINLHKAAQQRKSQGFSLIELLIVLIIVAVMTAMSLPYLLNYKKQYRSEDQSLKIMDLMRESSQMAMTRRRPFRFEIDLTNNQALIIDGRNPGPADDIQVKSLQLENAADLRVDQIPSGITRPIPPDYDDAVFANDTIGHLEGGTRVVGNSVWQISFRPDGTAVNAAGNPLSASLYVWTPLSPGNAAPKNMNEVRAITVFGGSGTVKYWKRNGTTFSQY